MSDPFAWLAATALAGLAFLMVLALAYGGEPQSVWLMRDVLGIIE